MRWVLLHIRGMNYKFHSLFLQGKWLVWLERKLISARQQSYGGRSGLSQSNPKDCVWLIILKHNPQISKVPPLLRFISAMTKVIMTRDEEKNLFTNPITQRILSSERWGVAKVAPAWGRIKVDDIHSKSQLHFQVNRSASKTAVGQGEQSLGMLVLWLIAMNHCLQPLHSQCICHT